MDMDNDSFTSELLRELQLVEEKAKQMTLDDEELEKIENRTI